MITENLSTLKIHKLTQEQYDRELAAGNIDENALYLTPDEVSDLSKYATIEQLEGKADFKHGHAITEITGAAGRIDTANSLTNNGTGEIFNDSGNVASGAYSHAEGYKTTALVDCSHAEGYSTKAESYASHVQGRQNLINGKVGQLSDIVGDAMVIGNGTRVENRFGAVDETYSNAFRVTFAGETYGLSAFNSSGADYAEFFEWEDGNEDAEDRVGYFVTLIGNHICKANPNDYILGIVSGQPCIIGNSDEDWLGRWEHDEFGRFIKEDVYTSVTEMKEVEVEVFDEYGNPTGETITKMQEFETGEITHGWKYKENTEYDSTQTYIERKDRKEWDAVGMLGVLSVIDDGTCEINGYAKVAQGGTATKAESYIHGMTYRVIKRMSDNVVQIIFK